MSPLDHKLLRDLWHMKGQATAIAVVMAMGVMLLVMQTGLVATLDETRDAYYERYRLADVFAPVSRAPERLVGRLAEVPGVTAAMGRVVGRALIEVPDEELPVQAQAVSLPDRAPFDLNDIYLTEGRLPVTGRSDEIVLLRSFARAHDLRPGDTLRATMNGARRTFRIVGLALSPEFLYTTAPGELVPDDARFGVIWMSRAALAAAFDMKGAFNEALLGLSRSANPAAVQDAVDRILAPYGGVGAYPLADQVSNRFISEEIAGLRASTRVVPPLFLGVAAFLLYIVISRMVQSERRQIGLMKAFGYTDSEVSAHYFKLVLVIATGGAVAGCLAGIAAGRALIAVYVQYFKFPFLVFQLDPDAFVIGVSISILAASAGGLIVLRRVFALTPAHAMRPPRPPDFSRAGQLLRGLSGVLDQPSRMVLRRIIRQPGRMAGATLGIAAGMALSVAMLNIHTGFDRAIELTFAVMDRSDVTVTFAHAVDDKTLFELARIPGVTRAEPVRHVPAILRNGLKTRRGAVIGMPEAPELNRALDDRAQPIPLPETGIVLSRALADILGSQPGGMLTVEVREGRQPVLEIPVAGIADTLLGAPAYMRLDALNRALREPGRVSGAYLTIDAARADAIYAELRDMPTVAGVSLKAQARDALARQMNQGAGMVRYIMSAIAFTITFGIVYNAARIGYAERAHEMAGLRVIGFSRAETAFVLLGELAVVTLVALPLGGGLGYYLSAVIAQGFSTDLYRIPVLYNPESFGTGVIVVVIAALVSGMLVKRTLDRADLVEALKTWE